MSVISSRERAVFQALARGQTTEEVAAGLHLSVHTVRSHVQSGMRKLGSRTRAQGVALAIHHGLISCSPADLDLIEPVEEEIQAPQR